MASSCSSIAAMKVQVNFNKVSNCEKTECDACDLVKVCNRHNKVETIKNNKMK